ncbi:hypothetical protein ATEIFO6365_0003082000 [Aspergillus terreus]|uniref:Uncharacterized protein n=1 Tax=Aspergillus terreus TaxID=33178 RepID=A0A5M3YSN8_ASPTE|nr:hypothetical protein ATETN484_0003076600 [Aspergillus terreus]GFF14752.1 hypothetical protein ATEIFO6365_0003082000 [Aspergillus terreus]
MSTVTSTLYQELQPVPSPYPPPSPPSQGDTVRSAWRFMGALSSYLLLVGYIVIPLAFGADDSTHVNKANALVAAAVLIAFAYTLSFMIACFQYDQGDYLLHSVFLPCLASDLIGLLNVLLNIFGRDLLPLDRLEIVCISLPSAFAFVYAIGALWIWAQQTIDEMPDQGTPLLTEEEQQRQQLLRLLHEDNGSRKRRSRKSAQSTFSVHVPERINPGKVGTSCKKLDKGSGRPQSGRSQWVTKASAEAEKFCWNASAITQTGSPVTDIPPIFSSSDLSFSALDFY